MIKHIAAAWRYFFPKRTIQQRLPLLPNMYSTRRGEAVPPHLVRTIRILKGFEVARTDQDAMLIIRQNPGASLNELLELRNKRRRVPPLVRAWQKFKELW